MSLGTLEKLLDDLAETSQTVDDTLDEVGNVKAVGEAIIGRGIILGESAQAHLDLVKKLDRRAREAREEGRPPSMLGTLWDVGEFILKR